MSALTTEQVDVALVLRELAGEPVPLSPGARELWVRYGMSVGMTGRQIQDAVDRLHPEDEASESRDCPYWTMPNQLGHLCDIVYSQGDVQRFTSERTRVSTTVFEYDGRDEFHFELSIPTVGDCRRLLVRVGPCGTVARPETRGLVFVADEYHLDVEAGEPAFEELAHLTAPLIRRALDVAPHAFALLELARA
ncbi:hypothetical protein [Deinococcus sedimenti]|uniref:Uncharacterized protein n=1 Tax=Deinococcus sedimenti TaxID=1867090 RepID=A0ABQ2S2Q1_9DEIO|nr:hypothetical protein [Deinococcus sedimenti]GGR84694.1 hypothetical protein GCM10008960_09650 [Deinococcus sedimenti]